MYFSTTDVLITLQVNYMHCLFNKEKHFLIIHICRYPSSTYTDAISISFRRFIYHKFSVDVINYCLLIALCLTHRSRHVLTDRRRCTDTVRFMYSSHIVLRSLQSTPIFSSISIIFTQFTRLRLFHSLRTHKYTLNMFKYLLHNHTEHYHRLPYTSSLPPRRFHETKTAPYLCTLWSCS